MERRAKARHRGGTPHRGRPSHRRRRKPQHSSIGRFRLHSADEIERASGQGRATQSNRPTVCKALEEEFKPRYVKGRRTVYFRSCASPGIGDGVRRTLVSACTCAHTTGRFRTGPSRSGTAPASSLLLELRRGDAAAEPIFSSDGRQHRRNEETDWRHATFI